MVVHQQSRDMDQCQDLAIGPKRFRPLQSLGGPKGFKPGTADRFEKLLVLFILDSGCKNVLVALIYKDQNLLQR